MPSLKPNAERRRPTPPTSLRVAAVQMKFRAAMADNVTFIEGQIARAAQRRADVVLFPECATTGYNVDFAPVDWMALDESLNRIGRAAGQHRLPVLVGSPIREGGRAYNALLVFDASGRLTYRYAKCQLTDADRRFFAPGDALALFEVAGVLATAIICHERRYPEMVRLPVMAGARLIFHPNAGLDPLAVSRRKRGGKDGIAVRAFENAVPYVFANSVGPQGARRWSAGDSKIVAADGTLVCLADHCEETMLVANLDLTSATGKYAVESLSSPQFLAADWQRMVRKVRAQAGRVGAPRPFRRRQAPSV